MCFFLVISSVYRQLQCANERRIVTCLKSFFICTSSVSLFKGHTTAYIEYQTNLYGVLDSIFKPWCTVGLFEDKIIQIYQLTYFVKSQCYRDSMGSKHNHYSAEIHVKQRPPTPFGLNISTDSMILMVSVDVPVLFFIYAQVHLCKYIWQSFQDGPSITTISFNNISRMTSNTQWTETILGFGTHVFIFQIAISYRAMALYWSSSTYSLSLCSIGIG